jgi:hypothetical protein
MLRCLQFVLFHRRFGLVLFLLEKKMPVDRRQERAVKARYGEGNYRLLAEGNWVGAAAAIAAVVVTDGAAGPVVEEVVRKAGGEAAVKAVEFIATHPGKQFKLGTCENIFYEKVFKKRVTINKSTLSYIVAF